MNLYTLPAEYRRWELAVEEQGGELTPALERELEEIEGLLVEKADAVCALVREAMALAAALRIEAAMLSRRASAAAHRAERLKALLLHAMRATGEDRIRTERFLVRRQTSHTPTIRWVGEGAIPGWATRTTVELDPKKAHEAYQVGANMTGFEVVHSEFLVIR